MVPPALRGLLRSTPTIAPIPRRGVLSVFGSQASEFLNGLLAASIREPIKGPIFSAFLHAQGRVLYDVFLYSSTDSNGKRGYLLEYDTRPSEAPPLLSYIKRHVLRSKVKVRDVSEEYDVWAAWGAPGDRLWESKRNWDWARSGAIEPVWDMSEIWPWGSTDMAINDRRAVGMGRRLLVGKGGRPQEAASHDLVSEESYALHRILHGVPEGSTEIVPMQAFPMDSNLDVMGGLDFRKGCYVGQELTVRTYHTGVVRKRILPVVIHPQDQDINNCIPTTIPLPVHAYIRPTLVENNDSNRATPRLRGTGRLLSSYQGVGLALLRLEHAAAVEKGDARLQLLLSGSENKTTFAVSHWCPTWWPLGALSAH